MSIRNLDKIFKPRHVAVVGASESPASVGLALMRNLLESGFEGDVFPVHPQRESVMGRPAYRSVADLPHSVDLALVCTPAVTVPEIVRECGEAGVLGLIVISAGFRELGAEGRALERRIQGELERFDGMRLLGPNCLGVMVPGMGLNASFAADLPEEGSVAFVSQSGALCTSVLDWALDEDVGFSCFVSIGNILDVDFGDLIDYLSSDPATQALILYVESIQSARKFVSAARAFTRSKPIVAYKAGRFALSARAAASHTGALAGEDAIYEAVFARAGIVRVYDSDDMFACAELLARRRPPHRERLAIVTNAGGPGVMATDALLARGGVLAALSAETLAKLEQKLPRGWSRANPVDILGDATPERFALALTTVLSDPEIDAALVILTPQAMTDPSGTARAVARVASEQGKPVLAVWMGGRHVKAGLETLNRGGIPTYATPEQAVQAFLYLVAYARRRSILYETPRDIPLSITPERSRVERLFRDHHDRGQEILTETDSKSVLESYGIDVTRPETAHSPDEAIHLARRIGYPVVLKIHSPQITHKTDVGGVALDLSNDEEVREAYGDILARAAEKRPDADVLGVTVQPMFTSATSFEMILGCKKDPTFGSAILVGMGGVAAEVLRDRAIGLPPLNERLARHLLESLRSWPLLEGYRGRPRAQLDKLVETLIRFSYLVADLPQIKELDINPLLVTPEDVVAVDARLVLDTAVLTAGAKPYAHLAIRPYPESYIQRRTLPDGTPVLLRPIRPEDEPAWLELLESCSPTTLFQRFQHVFKRSHELATRFCFIDYDREMAIVAEVESNGSRKLVGVGRLVSDPDHQSAEYAVLVTDAWQNRGLGSLLTDYCLEIAQSWQVPEIVAVTTPDNFRMVELFRRRGFEMSHRLAEGIVEVKKHL